MLSSGRSLVQPACEPVEGPPTCGMMFVRLVVALCCM